MSKNKSVKNNNKQKNVSSDSDEMSEDEIYDEVGKQELEQEEQEEDDDKEETDEEEEAEGDDVSEGPDEGEEEEEDDDEEKKKKKGKKKEDEEDGEEDEYEPIKDGQFDKKYAKTCFYKKPKEGSNESSEEEEEEEPVFEFDDEEDLAKISDTNLSPNLRITKPILTKYERVRLLSDRTTQLTRGAKPMIKNTIGLTSKRIAELELEHDVMPLKIRRPLPNGKYEIWYTKELKHDVF